METLSALWCNFAFATQMVKCGTSIYSHGCVKMMLPLVIVLSIFICRVLLMYLIR